MVKNDRSCDLCGLDIRGLEILQTVGGEPKQFCCQGCARVYQVAYDNQMLDQVLPQAPIRPKKIELPILTTGESAYFSVKGMWCAGCAVAAEQVLRKQPGVKGIDISFAMERGRIDFDPKVADPGMALKKLDGLGYEARLLGDREERRVEHLQEGLVLQLLAAIAFGMQIEMIYIEQLYPLYQTGQWNSAVVDRLEYLVWALATPVLFYGGLSFLRGAWRAFKAGTATMDTLMALGTLSAYAYSIYATISGTSRAYFDSVAMITSLVMIGRVVESYGGSQARKDIHALLSMQPERAWRSMAQGWERVQAADLQPDDLMLVKPGERVPADGKVIQGQASVDESLLTGESLPILKGEGDTVFAGTRLADDILVCRVTRPVGFTRLAQISQIVEQTLSTKPPIQRMVDRASAYFAYGILILAALTGAGWLITGHPLPQAVLAGVAVLVVACPCAMGLATPLTLAVTMGRATHMGILVQNTAALEAAAKINRVVFDKTGTITEGKFEVSTIQVASTNWQAADLLCLAKSVEQFSEHPIAKAIAETCSDIVYPTENFHSVRGLGVSALVRRETAHEIRVGSAEFVGITPDSLMAVAAHQAASLGAIVVWIGVDGQPAGWISLRDEIQPTAAEAMQRLRARGIVSTVLSGDHPDTTQRVAEQLGLEYDGGCLPEEKASHIRTWQAAGEKVGMVGDGVNDAPALAAADLSITVAGGTDIAGRTSDVVLTRPDLVLIPTFIRLSQQTRTTIAENLGWAFVYNIITVPLAILGILSPVVAAATMAASSLLVVGNSLRLKRK